MRGEHQQLAALLYGTGTRLPEGLPLQVKDLDFGDQVWCFRQAEGAAREAYCSGPFSAAGSGRAMTSMPSSWSASRCSGVALPRMPRCAVSP